MRGVHGARCGAPACRGGVNPLLYKRLPLQTPALAKACANLLSHCICMFERSLRDLLAILDPWRDAAHRIALACPAIPPAAPPSGGWMLLSSGLPLSMRLSRRLHHCGRQCRWAERGNVSTAGLQMCSSCRWAKHTGSLCGGCSQRDTPSGMRLYCCGGCDHTSVPTAPGALSLLHWSFAHTQGSGCKDSCVSA